MDPRKPDISQAISEGRGDGQLLAATVYISGLYALIPLVILLVIVGLLSHAPGLLLAVLWLTCTLPLSLLAAWALWSEWSLAGIAAILFICPPLNFLIWRALLGSVRRAGEIPD